MTKNSQPKKYDRLISEKLHVPKGVPKNTNAFSKMDFTHFAKFKVQETKSHIYICECGNRYLKTRKGQTQCLPCIAYGDNSRLPSRAMVR